MRITFGAAAMVVVVGCSKHEAKPSAAPVSTGQDEVASPTPAPRVAETSAPAGPEPAAKVLGPEAPPPQDVKLAPLGKLTHGGAFASLTGTGDISSGFDDPQFYGGYGFGKSGVGPGGGGSGWGSIGTSRYGTIGKGSGTGTGPRRGSACAPSVALGQPTARGDLDQAIIRRYIRRHAARLQYCYEKELLTKTTLAGTVASQFVIDHEGKVASVTATGVDPKVSKCVTDVIENIQFPAPKGGGAVQVSYPFTFRLADASCRATKP